MTLKEWMLEKKLVNRWFVLKVAMAGAFCGIIVMYMFALSGILSK
jgi:hypothetical protein